MYISLLIPDGGRHFLHHIANSIIILTILIFPTGAKVSP